MASIRLTPEVTNNKPAVVAEKEPVTDKGNEKQPETLDLVNGVDTKANTNTNTTKKIITDGPLSIIYAQALNIAYAKEGMAAGAMPDIVSINDLTEDTDADMYVYATSTTELNDQGGATDAFNRLRIALDTYKNTKSLVVIENTQEPTNSVAALEAYASSITKVSFSRKLAIEKILDSIGN